MAMLPHLPVPQECAPQGFWNLERGPGCVGSSHKARETQALPTCPLACVLWSSHLYPLDQLSFLPFTVLSSFLPFPRGYVQGGEGREDKGLGAPSVIPSSFCGPEAHTFGGWGETA